MCVCFRVSLKEFIAASVGKPYRRDSEQIPPLQRLGGYKRVDESTGYWSAELVTRALQILGVGPRLGIGYCLSSMIGCGMM